MNLVAYFFLGIEAGEASFRDQIGLLARLRDQRDKWLEAEPESRRAECQAEFDRGFLQGGRSA